MYCVGCLCLVECPNKKPFVTKTSYAFLLLKDFALFAKIPKMVFIQSGKIWVFANEVDFCFNKFCFEFLIFLDSFSLYLWLVLFHFFENCWSCWLCEAVLRLCATFEQPSVVSQASVGFFPICSQLTRHLIFGEKRRRIRASNRGPLRWTRMLYQLNYSCSRNVIFMLNVKRVIE